MKYVVLLIVAILLVQCSTPIFRPLAYYADNSLNTILTGQDISYNADSDFIDIAGTPFHFVKVDGGTFQMGSDTNASNERPVHQVTLNTYYISKTEVTQKLWRAVMYFETPSANTDLPIYDINWEDCQEFIKQLNKKLDINFLSLPRRNGNSPRVVETLATAISTLAAITFRVSLGLSKITLKDQNLWALNNRTSLVYTICLVMSKSGVRIGMAATPLTPSLIPLVLPQAEYVSPVVVLATKM